MDPFEQHDQENLERRLREAFAAKALQISDADLDRDREDEFATALSNRRRSRPVTRLFAAIGAAAAAVAIVVVTVAGLHGGDKHEVVNGLPPAITTSSASTTSSTTASTTTTTQGSTEVTRTPALNRPGTRSSRRTSAIRPTEASTSTSSAPSSSSTIPSSPKHTTSSSSSTLTSASTASALSSASHEPPAIPPGLPQAGQLSDRAYTGAVPLNDPSGGPKRMLSMPSETSWQRTAQDGGSLTVRLTYLSTDIEAYWRQTLPAEGWIQQGSGWRFPGTSYTVSPITDKGSFTVTW